ncbi:MAG: hypothetical protein ABIH59_02360 [archaeon]
MDGEGLGRLEKAALYLNGNNGDDENGKNNNLGYFSTKVAGWGYQLRAKGKVSKHTAGAIVSFHHGCLGKKAQTELEKLWEVGPGYFTKWHTTLWYGLSYFYEHGPLLGTSFLLDFFTGISEGNYIVAGNWVAGTGQNIIRGVSSFVFKRPMGVISAVAAPMQAHHYRKQIKQAVIDKHQEILQETDYLLRQ